MVNYVQGWRNNGSLNETKAYGSTAKRPIAFLSCNSCKSLLTRTCRRSEKLFRQFDNYHMYLPYKYWKSNLGL